MRHEKLETLDQISDMCQWSDMWYQICKRSRMQQIHYVWDQICKVDVRNHTCEIRYVRDQLYKMKHEKLKTRDQTPEIKCKK